MFVNKDDFNRTQTATLEEFFMQYKSYKKYVENANEAEKQTAHFKHRLTLVNGVEKVYPTLTDEMKYIVNHRYWYRDYQADWEDVADELRMTVSKAKKFRDIIIRKFAEEIGWR